ncbi:Tripartite DNA replication factor [Steccherinum ochraceum]|uniref:DNA replication ATP-dependent helicase/nuclease DNA2 n=1 Tax=Steccherinum ochraceum TaxID=92696 RepID=A0A4R0RSV6_9APHY|nr:Tripartite DNA replication factor [Steccherinum ochraceum]
MVAKTPSEIEELAFMDDILSGMDATAIPKAQAPCRPLVADAAKLARPTMSMHERASGDVVQRAHASKSGFSTPRKQKTLAVNMVTPRSSRRRTTSSPAKPTSHNETSELLEGVADWDWDDMNSDFMTPKKPKPPTITQESSKFPETQISTRCIVKTTELIDTADCYEKILTVQAVGPDENRRVVLQDDWVETDLAPGDVINVIGPFSLPPSSSSSAPLYSITITSRQNLLIHHPDQLITATSLSDAPRCRRKPLLSNLVRSSTDVTPSLVWGNMLHEVMQTCLADNAWGERDVNEKISDVVKRGLGDLLSINVSAEQAEHEVKARAKGLKAFSERYISQEPKDEAVLTDTRSGKQQKALLAISDLHDVEEDIWSPTYGLKGKIDASVQAVIVESGTPDNPFTKASNAKPSPSTDSPMPFEIKTGRSVAGMEHRAQTMLYTLLMAERYRTEVPSGLLYYTQSEEVVKVPAARNEIRALVLARNELAGYMMKRVTGTTVKVVGSASGDTGAPRSQVDAEVEIETVPFLPSTLDESHICGRCFVLDTCMLYRKAVENVVDDTSEIADMYALKTSHLTPTQGNFFKKWEALISLEEQDLLRFRKELWTMTAVERENKGRAFSSMVLDNKYDPPASSLKATLKREGKIHQYTYRFTKSAPANDSLLSGHMSVGDAVTVSVDPDLLALARGFIVGLTPQEVIVGVDHVVDPKKIATRNGCTSGSVVFRIDKDELFAGMGRVRGNLAQLFYADGDTRRLNLVVDLQAPQFEEWNEDIASEHVEAFREIAKLNTNQRLAVRKVLCAKDYALILGMPGTGKTTVIATLIKALVHMGKSVLLTSYTHSAVDTILMKLKEGVDFTILRLGSLDKIHPEVQGFTLAARRPAATVEQLEQQVMTPAVVATTCLALDHPLFSRRKFDYCIVDEASQVTLPTCLGPLRFADKFVLVGDHFQLPPLVRNRDAKRGGLDVSLFRRLSDAHPAAVVDLNEQYRMNEDIMTLSNRLIYSGRLRCGNEETATRGLHIPSLSFMQGLHEKSQCDKRACWLDRLLDPSCKAIFVDTDDVPAQDSRVGDLTQNVTEARLVHQVTECLVRGGVHQKQIGVISLYRQQIKLISYLLQEWKDIDILTADRSQGRDKDCIIISMVRSNDLTQIGDLMKDWRRMNVAFTRARSKLIIFGSRSTLQAVPLLTEFFTLMNERGWILRLPKDADQLHGSPASSPNKRTAGDELVTTGVGKRTPKKLKVSAFNEDGLLRGRPILQDVVNAEK